MFHLGIEAVTMGARGWSAERKGSKVGRPHSGALSQDAHPQPSEFLNRDGLHRECGDAVGGPVAI